MSDPHTELQPADTGSKGTQGPSIAGQEVSLIRATDAGGLSAYPVSNAILEMAETRTRGFGNITTFQLLAAYTQQVTIENSQLRNEVRDAQTDNRQLSDSLHAEKGKNGILREKLLSDMRNRPLRNVCITLGSAMALWGIDLLSGSNLKMAVGALVFGTVLIILGWLSAPTHKELP